MTTQVERSRHQLELTGRRIVAGTWGCAAITMAGSAASAAVAYDYLGEHWGLGLATGIAVDIALCVGLVGDRQLYLHGLSSTWGRALRVTTALMSLVLNSGVAFAQGRYFLAFLHAFLPVLLVVLTEYGQDVLLKFSALAREQHTTQQPPTMPVPIAEPVPQPHWPVAPPPVPTAPVPPLRPVRHERSQEQPAWTPTLVPKRSAELSPVRSPATSPDGDNELVTRVRKLIADSNGRAPGRRMVAKRLGITEHQARVALEVVGATKGPALNGAAATKPRGIGRSSR